MAKNHIFSVPFWKAYWVAFRRMHRDRMALKFVLRTTLFFAVFVLYNGWLLKMILGTRDGETYFILGGMASLLIGAFSLIKIWHWKDERTTRREVMESVDIAQRDRFRQEAFTLAILLERASSEQMMQNKILPEGVEVITRRTHLDRLRKLGMIDAFSSPVRALLLRPDGHWTPKQINTCWLTIETLRCFRWVLGLDEQLASLGDVVAPGGAGINRLLQKPERLLHAKHLLDPWDVRVERDIAHGVFLRCYAEQIARGLIPDVSDVQRESAIEFRENVHQSPHEDYLVGVRTVLELSDSDVSNLLLASYWRWSCLEQIMAVMEGAGWEGLHDATYSRLFEHE